MDYSRMIAIPFDKFNQLSTVQNVRQPLTEQFNRLQDDYEKNLHVNDAQRSIALQSQTIEQMKDLKDRMRNYLTITTPKPFRTRAQSLYQHIEPYLKVSDKGEIIKDDGSVISSSNVEDLIQYAVRDRRRRFMPEGWNYFIDLMKKFNVPKSALNRETLDEMDSSKPITFKTPLIKRTASKATPFVTPKQSPSRSRSRARSTSKAHRYRARSRTVTRGRTATRSRAVSRTSRPQRVKKTPKRLLLDKY